MSTELQFIFHDLNLLYSILIDLFVFYNSTVEDPEHSDFLKIRKMLIATHMQDLKEVTHDILYEQFRAQLISSMTPTGSG